MARDIKAFGRNVEAELERTFSKIFLMRLGKLARDLVYRRVKSGYGVSSDTSSSPSKERLKPLSQGYINYRSGIADFKARDHRGKKKRVRFKTKKPTLGPFATPRKSNLTLTGQMLEALGHRIIDGVIQVYVSKTRREGESITNDKLAEMVRTAGREFLALTTDEQKILVREIEKEIRRLSRRLSKTR